MIHGKSSAVLEADQKRRRDNGVQWYQSGVPTPEQGMDWRAVMRVQKLLESKRKETGVCVAAIAVAVAVVVVVVAVVVAVAVDVAIAVLPSTSVRVLHRLASQDGS